MIRTTFKRLALPAIATALLMLLPTTSFAQRGRGGFYAGPVHYGGVGGYRYGGFGYGGYRSYYGGYGYRPYYGSYYGYRRPFYGYGGGFYPYYSYGLGYPYSYGLGYPYGVGYSSSLYYPDYYYSTYPTVSTGSGVILSGGVAAPDTAPTVVPTDTTANVTPSTQEQPVNAPNSQFMNTGNTRITVRLPADAELWFNGTKMTATGTSRDFLVPPVAAGQQYSYTVRARWTENGNTMDQSRTVTFTPGNDVQITFPKPDGEQSK